jgi:hypothetical protein
MNLCLRIEEPVYVKLCVIVKEENSQGKVLVHPVN